MTTGAYKDAIKAYQNADVVQVTAQAAFHRSRCYSAISRVDESVHEMKKVLELCPEEDLSFPDYRCLTLLSVMLRQLNPGASVSASSSGGMHGTTENASA